MIFFFFNVTFNTKSGNINSMKILHDSQHCEPAGGGSAVSPVATSLLLRRSSYTGAFRNLLHTHASCIVHQQNEEFARCRLVTYSIASLMCRWLFTP